MKRTLTITKMHGLGNSYIYINTFTERILEAELPSLARRLSDVHTGIGADGMILIGPSACADFCMRMFNRDGSEGKCCGNGLRCVAKYVYEKEMINSPNFTIETLGGIVNVTVHMEANRCVGLVTIDMGEPCLYKKDIPMLGDPDSETIDEVVSAEGESYLITAVSVGNPHVVHFVDDVQSVALEKIGPRLEKASLFPEGANVELVHVRNSRELDVRVWERGSGITQACGTGACAAVVASVLAGRLSKDDYITVHLPGGDLEILWSSANGHIYMRGDAEMIFEGTYHIA